MKNIIIIISLVLLFSCSNRQTNQNENLTIMEGNPTDERIIDSSIITSQLEISQYISEVPYELRFNEVINRFGGVVYNTYITDEVNVYLLPNFESKIKENLSTGTSVQIIGISDNKTLENNDEYWVKIYYRQEGFNDPKVGWILSNFIGNETLVVSNLLIERTEIVGSGNLVLYGKYIVENFVKEFSVSTNKLDNQYFYTFSWDYTSSNFHHSNKPGLYTWDESKKELRHISYVGGQGSKWGFSSWSVVTDDFKYMLQDQGTAPPPRGVVVWNLENGEEIFSASYYVEINLRGHSINIVRHFSTYYNGNWSIPRNFNEEEINFGNYFKEENEPPEEWVKIADAGGGGNALSLFLIYEYNIETKEIKIISGQYIQTM